MSSDWRRPYRRLLGLLPPRLRLRHGAEMEEMFGHLLRRARLRGPLHAVLAWLAALLDILGAAAREPGRAWRRRGLGSPPARRAIVMGSDLRCAFRVIARQKLASVLVIAMLAIGIAANVAVFSLVNGLFLRPFPFPEPDRLAYINERAPRWNLTHVGVNYPDFHHWRQGVQLFDAIALFEDRQVTVSDGKTAERLAGLAVTHDFDDVLRVTPTIGRFFAPDEDRPDGPAVVVIGHGLWRERFAGSPQALGRPLRLDGMPHTIVGVLPPAAEFPGAVRLWLPMAGDPEQEGQSYGAAGIGRLKPGVTIAAAEEDLLRAHQPVFDARDTERTVSPFARSLREEFVQDFAAVASTLSAAVALLLVVACANVASVMLAHAIARRREMAIRVAVGAGRLRLVRQLLIENAVMAAIGGVIGLVLGRAAVAALVAAVPANVPAWARFDMDVRVAGFALLVSVGTVVLFGWAPALHAARSDLRDAMNNAANAPGASPAGRRTLSLLVGAEFAVAVLLVVCGGLLARAYSRVRDVDPGFNSSGVLLFRLALPEATYGDESQRLAFWDRAVDRLHAIPGVEAAGLVTCPPLDCHWGTFYRAEGQPPPEPGQANPVVLFRFATPEYFETMGIAVRHGRFFEARDGRNGGEMPVIVNETFARTFFPGIDDVVGRRLRGLEDDAPWRTIVGVARDVKHYGLEREMRPGVYFPLPMAPPSSVAVALRASGETVALAGPARAAIRELDPELPIFEVRTIDEVLRRSLAVRALYSWMLAVFAALALVLALSGANVTSYLVTQRARELGIRMALGAQRLDIARTLARGGLVVAAAGVFSGVIVSTAAGRLLASQLFGVEPRDLTVLGSAAALLLFCAALANWLPAARAARIDPGALLRAD